MMRFLPMIMQQTDAGGSEVALLLIGAVIFGIILTVLWTLLPFAVFGIKSKLETVISEQRHTTEAIHMLRKDFRLVVDKALAEPQRTREGRPAHL